MQKGNDKKQVKTYKENFWRGCSEINRRTINLNKISDIFAQGTYST